MLHAALSFPSMVHLRGCRYLWLTTTQCLDRTVTRPVGQALLGSQAMVEAKPHREAFPGGRQVQGKTRRSIGVRVRPHRGTSRHQSTAVDQCSRQTAREL